MKMQLPPGFWDISLWLAVTSITSLTASELISPYYGQTNRSNNKKRLKNVSPGITTAT